MQTVTTQTRRLDDYAPHLPHELIVELQGLAKRLRGSRVLQLNSTATGGGVAEMLRSVVPLYKDLEIECEWAVFDAPRDFFRVTKAIHNALQGGKPRIGEDDWRLYEEVNQAVAEELARDDWDHVLIHDPQPAAVLSMLPPGRQGATWAWRCHIDASHADPAVLGRLLPLLQHYDATVFSLKDYVPTSIASKARLMPPGIDPLDPKNAPLAEPEAWDRLARFGIDPERPLITQVSRFDPWKDPVGVIHAWEKARQEVPGLQLALVGQSADDDPESKSVLRDVKAAAEGKRGLFVIADDATDAEVNAFQVASRAIVQKSLREGFGLTVAEALWAGTPVIGGDAGGIPLQVRDGENGFLVHSVDGCARAMAALAKDPARAARMGQAGREHVRGHFLLPRLLRDELRMWHEIEASPSRFVREAF